MSFNGMGQGVAAGVNAFNQSYDYTNAVRDAKEERAIKLKQQAETHKVDLEQKQENLRKANIQTGALDELYGQATGGNNNDAEMDALRKQVKQLQETISKQSGIDVNKQVASQVTSTSPRETLGQLNAFKDSNPTMQTLFGKESIKMPSKDSVEDRQAMYAFIAQTGGKPSPELADRMMDSGLYYLGQNGRIVDANGMMAVMGTFKYFTPEQKKAYEGKIQMTMAPTEAISATNTNMPVGSGEPRQNPEVAGSSDEVETQVESIRDAQSEDNEIDTQRRVDGVNAYMDKLGIAKIEDNVDVSPPTKEDKHLEDVLERPKPKDEELLRAIAGVRAAPTDRAKTAMQSIIDMATELTGGRENYTSDEEYNKALIDNIQALKFNPNTGSGKGGDTAAIKTMKIYSEIADNKEGKYTPTEVQMAKNYIQSHNPNNPTSTMRNIEFKDKKETGEAMDAIGGTSGSIPSASSQPSVQSSGKGNGGLKAPPPLVRVEDVVLPSGVTRGQAAEQVTFEKGINKDTLKAVKEEAVDMTRRAQGLSRLVGFKDKLRKLYKNGKMDAGYVDDFFQYIGERVPIKNGTIDQTLANAKIKDYIIKAVQESNGKSASNQEAQRQIEIITGGNGFQEEQRFGLFSQFVASQVNDYSDLRNRMKDSKQYDAISKADKYYSPKSSTNVQVGQKVLNKRDGKYYIKQPNGKYKLAE